MTPETERSRIDRYMKLVEWVDEHRHAHQCGLVLQCILREMSMIL